MVRVIVGVDTLAFDLNQLGRDLVADSRISPNSVPPDRLAIDVSGVRHRMRLLLLNLNGTRQGDTVEVRSWSGQLYVGPR
jgi:hypothetical protein